MDWVKIADWIKQSPYVLCLILCLIAIVLGLLLFGPAIILKKLALEPFYADYRKYIGFVFLIAIVLLLLLALSFLYTYFQKRLTSKRNLQQQQQRLLSLTPEEKEILSRHTSNNTKTQYFDLYDGVVSGLEQEGIIFRSANLSRHTTCFAYNISSWAWVYLNKNPHLLEGFQQPVSITTKFL